MTPSVLPKKTIHRQHNAHELANRLPRLSLEARRVALTVQSGLHGRRKAGLGETFWQFRPFTQGEAANRIDWRRSSRDNTLYVREREWEAAHTLWLWIDQSPSMHFQSDWAMDEKTNHAIILGLALAELMTRSGERVGLWEQGKASHQRDMIYQLALMLIEETEQPSERPRAEPLDRFHEMVVVTDGLSPLPDWQNTIDALAGRGARGHLVLIRDPAEITLPYEGHYRLHSTETDTDLEIGDVRAFRNRYQERMTAHHDGLKLICAQKNWGFYDHQTDKPLAPILLALAQALLQAPANQTGLSDG